MTVSITVIGSVNLDLVATAPRLPVPGETVTGATFARHPGGKGANQALAASRLGANVRLVGRVGDDAMAEEALALLRSGRVDLSAIATDPDAPSGVALIAVDATGENIIVVAPGSNARLAPDNVPTVTSDALIAQLEVPNDAIAAAVASFAGFVTLNLAPARPVPDTLLQRADLIVVNETEAAFYGSALDACPGRIAVTLGAHGARLSRKGELSADATPPAIAAVDATGAGDAFVAALTVALIEGQTDATALRFACAAGALAATTAGAQPSLPMRAAVDGACR